MHNYDLSSWGSPNHLFRPERLDLAIKRRLFCDLLTGMEQSIKLYCWHIEKRTGGREPGSWKRSIADYLRAAEALLVQMSATGFDPSYPVKVNHIGDLVAGAHRVACASALGQSIYIEVRDKRSPGIWGAAWFLGHGCDPATVAGLVRESEAIRG